MRRAKIHKYYKKTYYGILRSEIGTSLARFPGGCISQVISLENEYSVDTSEEAGCRHAEEVLGAICRHFFAEVTFGITVSFCSEGKKDIFDMLMNEDKQIISFLIWGFVNSLSSRRIRVIIW